jgi:RecA/RadA recombinase
MLLRDGDISLVVVDSIGGMESKAAFEKKAEDSAMGKNSQAITRMVKQVAGSCRANNAAVIFVNQYRADVGNPRGGQKGAGPSALKYATTTKVEMKRTGEPPLKVPLLDSVSESIKDIEVAKQLRAKVVRNKLAAPGYGADFWLRHKASDQWGAIGIDRADEALTLGIATGAIERLSVSSYGLPDGTKIVGRGNVKTALQENPDLAETVRQRALLLVSGEVRDEREVSFEDEDAS